METDCTPRQFEFQACGRRKVTARFDGGTLSTEGGALLLAQVDRRLGLIRRLAQCFVDYRDPSLVEHSLEHLLRQRVFALALGYEDLNDHDRLRADPLLAAVIGKAEPSGRQRRRHQDRGKALAGKSTLHRLEWGLSEQAATDRYRRIGVDVDAVDRFWVELFLDAHSTPPGQIVLDFDATDVPLHGDQEGRFFHGYYGCYCYLPLYIYCDKHLLAARLRPSNIDGAAGCVDELSRIVEQIRQRWPNVQIIARGDSGFAREALMAWCEQQRVDYVVGLARNQRLEDALEPTMEAAHELCAESGEPERLYGEWMHSTLNSWSRQRRVIGKAEITPRGPNPRFVVTSLEAEQVGAKDLYEQIFCARGEMENRIKEQQLDLFATRVPGRLMRVNQLRLWLSAAAYTLLEGLRRLALQGSEMERAQGNTIRVRLLKIAARVRVTVRRVWVALATAHPAESTFAHAYDALQRAGPSPA